MTVPSDSDLRILIDEVVNALQVAILLAQHVERTSTTTAQDATAIIRNLRRVTEALENFRLGGGAR